MNAREKIDLENKWYWHAYYFFCETTKQWLERDNMRCMHCDKTEDRSKCIQVGGKYGG
jgi:hypothetical protein